MSRNNIKYSFIAILCITQFLTSTQAFAGRHWLGGSSVQPADTFSDLVELRPLSTSARNVLDLVVSLYKTPSSQAEMARYEQVMDHFADAVYEATEGRMKIGNIYIYTDYRFASKADILWRDEGRPNSPISAYDTFEGVQIRMFDKFGSWDVLGNFDITKETENDYKLAGYALAHEFCHYAFGLYDEYIGTDAGDNGEPSVPHTDDDDVQPSIMNTPYCAVGKFPICLLSDGLQWLNFSIPWREDSLDLFHPFQIREKTAQHRMYGKSAWETLTSDPSNDFKSVFFNNKALRMQFLALQRPQNDPIIQLPSSDARSALDVIWMTENLVYQIVIDKSGSMGGAIGYDPNKIINAKSAAKYLVDSAEVGKTSIGVIAFNESPSIVQPITPINTEADKEAIKNAIDAITSNGGTALYDAAMTAMSGLLSQSGADSRVVFLLTDGVDTSSGSNKTTVISSYQTNKVPLFTFAYGSDADMVLLNEMATETRGKYYNSPTTQPEITLAFNDAKKMVTSELGIKTETRSLQACIPPDQSSLEVEYVIDSSLTRILNTIIFSQIVNASDLLFWLKNPNGENQEILEGKCGDLQGNNTVCSFYVDLTNAGMSGTWKTVLSSKSCQKYENIKFDVGALSEMNNPCSLSASNLTGSSVQYPSPLLINAILSKDLPIAGAEISGTIEFPDGFMTQLAFRDDGVAPDYASNDGNYAAFLNDYDLNGTYTIKVNASNAGNNAYMTYNGALMSPDIDGNLTSLPSDIPLGEDFNRFYIFQITVDGVVGDDFGNTFPGAASIIADNRDHPGKIEIQDDIDFFRVTLPDPSAAEIVFRVTHLSSEMFPVMTVYDETGTPIKEVTMTTLSLGYPTIAIKPNGRNVFYASVRHNYGGTGTYCFSGGSSVISDGVAKPPAIELPQTGQHTCFDNYGNMCTCGGLNCPPGQDAELQTGFPWPNPRFRVGEGTEAACILDGLTGLMWSKNGNMTNQPVNWHNALDFVASINNSAGLCGHNDWRLPNINELESLVNANADDTASWLNSNGFLNVQPNLYWSSTTHPYYSETAWFVVMDFGYVGLREKDNSSYSYLLPVRTGGPGTVSLPRTGQEISYAPGDDADTQQNFAWPHQRFIDNGDGTVKDNLTDIVWLKDANCIGTHYPSFDNYGVSMDGRVSWEYALNFVIGINDGIFINCGAGFYDWRLPNKKELFSLSDFSQYDTALPAGHPFINLQDIYWSSTNFAVFASSAWLFNTTWGNTGYDDKFSDYFVWPVRGGCSANFTDIPIGFWAENYIRALFCKGITTGYPDGTYRPSVNVTRAQMAAFIIRAKYGEDFSYSTMPYFTDVPPSNQFFKYIQKMYDEGITTGYEDSTYRPSQYVTRSQMATFIIRALLGDSFSYSSTPHFTDVPDSHGLFKYIQKMYDEGITTGYVDGTYRPSQNVNRAQMATFIAKAFLGMD